MIEPKFKSGKVTSYAKERDAAFIDFVTTGNREKMYKFMQKYGLEKPKDDAVFQASIYKATHYCTNIPDDVKTQAALKCLQLGFSPFINLGGIHE